MSIKKQLGLKWDEKCGLSPTSRILSLPLGARFAAPRRLSGRAAGSSPLSPFIGSLAGHRRHARFKAATGESPIRYRSRMRVSQARMLLQRTDLSLEAIAHSLGYCDAFHFSKSFKKEAGCSPRDFRNRSHPSSVSPPP